MKIFSIYSDELKGLGLSMNEKAILSIYKYFTENGAKKCCMIKNNVLAKELEINEAYLGRLKQGLKEKGFIKVDAGGCVKYLGVRQTKTFKEKDELKYYILGCIREVNSNIELSHIELFDKEIEDMWNSSTLNNKNSRVIFKDVLDEFVDKIINGYKEIRLDYDELLNEIVKVDPKIERNKYVIFQAKNWFSNKYDGSGKRTSKKVFSNYDILRYALELKRVIELNNE